MTVYLKTHHRSGVRQRICQIIEIIIFKGLLTLDFGSNLLKPNNSSNHSGLWSTHL